MESEPQWPAFDAPLVPSERPMTHWHQSIISALELRLVAERLREAAEPVRGVPCDAIADDDSPAAVLARIEHAYEKWLEEEAERRDVGVALLLEEVSARFWHRARSRKKRTFREMGQTTVLGGAAPAHLILGVSSFTKECLEAEAARQGISMNALIAEVAETFAGRAWRRAQRALAEAAGTKKRQTRAKGSSS